MEDEENITTSFAEKIGSRMIGFVPRNKVVRDCENEGMTVIEGKPMDPQADTYRKLADTILSNRASVVPHPINPDERRRILRR